MNHVKNIAALLLAAASAYCLSFAADLLLGRLFGLFPDTVWLPIGTWSGIFAILFYAAASLSRKRWPTVIPFVLFGGLALFGAIVGSHPHSYLVVAVLFVVAVLRWRAHKTRIKITPDDFVKAQLAEIFSSKFIDAETKGFASLSQEIPIFQRVNLDKYLRERQNAICNLFQIAWDRNTPHAIFIEHYSIMSDDPRVKAINTEVYDRALSRAQEAGMDTFGFISRVFIGQIIPQDIAISEADYSKLYEIYGTDFTSLYISFEASIRQYRFVK